MTITDRPEIVGQQSIPGEPDRFTIKVPAPTKQAAKVRARAFLRTEMPTAKRIKSPEVQSRSKTEQSSIRQFFPESLKQKNYKVDLLVVR